MNGCYAICKICILSTRNLLPELFPPTVLQNVTANAIEMVCKIHPDYALATRHITKYYDMKLAMFGLDSDGSMVVAFPVFVKDHASEPKTLYEIEMVKVPIPNRKTEADSYSEVKYSKSYLAINEDYYILKGAITLKPPIIFRTISLKYDLSGMTRPPKTMIGRDCHLVRLL